MPANLLGKGTQLIDHWDPTVLDGLYQAYLRNHGSMVVWMTSNTVKSFGYPYSYRCMEAKWSLDKTNSEVGPSC